ncbi:MAG TPA: glutaminyl-peptide cyclotransferase, partial [Prolixibacteraceae bacterium]|nr:glutaminyl-peptide cyclotransferase [Prolixibacteraceae bacterium]
SFPDGFVNNLNELEYVDGVIYANIWTSENIVKFDAETGKVLAFINMSGLLSNFNAQRVDVLNGIAYHPDEQLFYVTGKWWPRVFKVVFE